MKQAWPDLTLGAWVPTRANLHHRARAIGAVPRAALDPHPHWWHLGLRPTRRGLTTVPIPGTAGEFTIDLDLHRHVAGIEGPDRAEIPLDLPAKVFVERLAAALTRCTEADIEFPQGPEDATYKTGPVDRYAAALEAVAGVFTDFADVLDEETSPVQLWPHHLDLALTWFSGRTVPGSDPADPDHARESATVGFSTGDEAVPEAYFYAIAHPFPEALTNAPPPGGSHWTDRGFRGAILRYSSVAETTDPDATLREFLGAYYEAVSPLMR